MLMNLSFIVRISLLQNRLFLLRGNMHHYSTSQEMYWDLRFQNADWERCGFFQPKFHHSIDISHDTYEHHPTYWGILQLTDIHQMKYKVHRGRFSVRFRIFSQSQNSHPLIGNAENRPLVSQLPYSVTSLSTKWFQQT